ncbi:MAG: hypothetical protein BAJATHORv1_110044 [Candidatus Thorarchaeota archaeon]|nr:MAG: hypothetical protein BAJATHORv1_110044 [Candidatus Thorarchaeota archaeon]
MNAINNSYYRISYRDCVNTMAKLVCVKCGEEVDVPVHCGKEMHQEGDQLVCWMGRACGHQDVPQHCGAHMEVKS